MSCINLRRSIWIHQWRRRWKERSSHAVRSRFYTTLNNESRRYKSIPVSLEIASFSGRSQFTNSPSIVAGSGRGIPIGTAVITEMWREVNLVFTSRTRPVMSMHWWTLLWSQHPASEWSREKQVNIYTIYIRYPKALFLIAFKNATRTNRHHEHESNKFKCFMSAAPIVKLNSCIFVFCVFLFWNRSFWIRLRLIHGWLRRCFDFDDFHFASTCCQLISWC